MYLSIKTVATTAALAVVVTVAVAVAALGDDEVAPETAFGRDIAEIDAALDRAADDAGLNVVGEYWNEDTGVITIAVEGGSVERISQVEATSFPGLGKGAVTIKVVESERSVLALDEIRAELASFVSKHLGGGTFLHSVIGEHTALPQVRFSTSAELPTTDEMIEHLLSPDIFKSLSQEAQALVRDVGSDLIVLETAQFSRATGQLTD